MQNGALTMQETRNPKAVREFFDQWSIYCRIVDNNYLYHSSVREVFADWLDQFGRPFSFLDLGCGDARFSSELLQASTVTSYTGIDISPVALGLAEQNTRDLRVPCSLRCVDFVMDLPTLPGLYDIIYIGLSLHHLGREEKGYFFGELLGKLAPGGALIVFDPVLAPGETRDAYMGRWVDHAEWTWKSLSMEEVAGAVEHVTTSDFPEELSTLNGMALKAGFHPCRILFEDRTDFYALMEFRA